MGMTTPELGEVFPVAGAPEAALWIVIAAPKAGLVRAVPFQADGSGGTLVVDTEWLEAPARARGYVDVEALRTWPVNAFGPKAGLLRPSAVAKLMRASIREQVRTFVGQQFPERIFEPGVSSVPVSGRKFGPEEVDNLVDASLDFWLTTGRYNTAFEKSFAKTVGVRHALTVNSGSSANLLAVAAVTDHTWGEDAVHPGDEVITAAAGFPTTVNPLLQYGITPVFVDVQLGTYVPTPEDIAAAVSPKTKGIILAHTLGNPVDMKAVRDIADEHDLWVIEDACDALGSTFNGQPVGSFGDLSTFSFYPAHQITMGEGGAVCTSDPRLKKVVESFRDWGRDCWCAPGEDNTCGKRFGFQLGELPHGYDHKYTYARVGYNLKITDMQAAIGCAQIERLPEFVAARKRNFRIWMEELAGLEGKIILPEATPGSDPAWFGFPITLRPGKGPDREAVLRGLQAANVHTRNMFGGNLVRQPYFKEQRYRVSGDLSNSDRIMTDTFWVGLYPGLTEAMVLHAAKPLRSALST